MDTEQLTGASVKVENGNGNWKWLSKCSLFATAVAVASLCALILGISILVPRGGLDH